MSLGLHPGLTRSPAPPPPQTAPAPLLGLKDVFVEPSPTWNPRGLCELPPSRPPSRPHTCLIPDTCPSPSEYVRCLHPGSHHASCLLVGPGCPQPLTGSPGRSLFNQMVFP